MKSKKAQHRGRRGKVVATAAIATPIPAGARLIGVQQAADALGLSVWTVRAKLYSGQWASHKIGGKKGRLMMAPQELDRIVAESARPRVCA